MTEEELKNRYLEGQTLREIAETAGCEMQTIANRIAKLRDVLPYRRPPLSRNHPRRRLAAARKELVLKLHSAGVPVVEIAQRVGINPQYVTQIISQAQPKNYDDELARLQKELA